MLPVSAVMIERRVRSRHRVDRRAAARRCSDAVSPACLSLFSREPANAGTGNRRDDVWKRRRYDGRGGRRCRRRRRCSPIDAMRVQAGRRTAPDATGRGRHQRPGDAGAAEGRGIDVAENSADLVVAGIRDGNSPAAVDGDVGVGKLSCAAPAENYVLPTRRPHPCPARNVTASESDRGPSAVVLRRRRLSRGRCRPPQAERPVQPWRHRSPSRSHR